MRKAVVAALMLTLSPIALASGLPSTNGPSDPRWKVSRTTYALLKRALGQEEAARMLGQSLDTFSTVATCNAALEKNPEALARYYGLLKQLKMEITVYLPAALGPLITAVIDREKAASPEDAEEITPSQLVRAAIVQGFAFEKSSAAALQAPLLERANAAYEETQRFRLEKETVELSFATIDEIENLRKRHTGEPGQLSLSKLVNLWVREYLKRKLPADFIQSQLKSLSQTALIACSGPKKQLRAYLPDTWFIRLNYLVRQAQAQSPHLRLTRSDFLRAMIVEELAAEKARADQMPAIPPPSPSGSEEVVFEVPLATWEEIRQTLGDQLRQRPLSYFIRKWVGRFVERKWQERKQPPQ